MKYCVKCGAELVDEAVLCPKCGVMQQQSPQKEEKKTNKGIQTANKVLLVILCVSLALMLILAIVCTIFSASWLQDIKNMMQSPEDEYGGMISLLYWMFSTVGLVSFWLGALPLAWTLPMTLHYFKKCKEEQPTTLAFKICTLIFTHQLVGIFMLCFEPNADNK